MYVVPKHLYEAYLTQGDRSVKEAVSSINIRQLNNIQDTGRATIQANDIIKGGQQRLPGGGGARGEGGDVGGGDSLGGVNPGAGVNLGQTIPSEVTNLGQMREERGEHLPPPHSHNNSSSPQTSLVAEGEAPPPSQVGATQTLFNDVSNVGTQTSQPTNNALTGSTQTENKTEDIGVQATRENDNAAVQTENDAATISTQTEVPTGVSTGTDSPVWDFWNPSKRRLTSLRKEMPTQTDFAPIVRESGEIPTQTDFVPIAREIGEISTQTEIPSFVEQGVQVTPPPPPPPKIRKLTKFSPSHTRVNISGVRKRDASYQVGQAVASTGEIGVQVSLPPQTHVSIPNAGQQRNVGSQVAAATQTRPQLSLASQLSIDIPSSVNVTRRVETGIQTDPPTSISTSHPVAIRKVKTSRPSWVFKSISRPNLYNNPVPSTSSGIGQRQQRRRPLGLSHQRRNNQRGQLAITYKTSLEKLPPKTPKKVTVRRGIRDRKAPAKFSPEMLTRRVHGKKGESKASFARRLNLDDTVPRSPSRSRQNIRNNIVQDNPLPSTSSGTTAATSPRWIPSKLAAKRTATAAHMDTPLSKPKVGGKRGRPNKGEKRSLPNASTPQQHKKRAPPEN